MLLTTVWIAVLLVGGTPQAGVFPSKDACLHVVAQVEAIMVKDGPDDGDMLSGCYEVTLREPAGEKS